MIYLKEKIMQESSSAYNQEQNGYIERENRTIKNHVRTMMIGLPAVSKMINEAMITACYLKNRLPTSRSRTTPFERFTGRKPGTIHLHPFATIVHVIHNVNRPGKFGERTVKEYLVGFTNRINTYKVYIPQWHRCIETPDLIFGKALIDINSKSDDIINNGPGTSQDDMSNSILSQTKFHFINPKSDEIFPARFLTFCILMLIFVSTF